MRVRPELRRAAGASSTAWPAQQLAAAASRGRAVCAAAGRQRPQRDADAPVIDAEFEVPQVGWMWDSGKAAATRKSLKTANIKAKKSLGQNFCTDDRVLSDIVRAARVAPGDAVIEVGPGTGNLTRHLLAARARVLAVEKDDTLAERLRAELGDEPNFRLVHGDVMRLDFEALVQDAAAFAAGGGAEGEGDGDGDGQPGTGDAGGGQPGPQRGRRRGVKVVANLPYNITKQFLQALLPRGGAVAELSVMIQHEVAERLADPTPARPDYRAMSVVTHFYSRPVYRFRIPKEKYFPVPGVDGALVTFKLLPPARREAVLGGGRAFVSTVNAAFAERRKMMRNTLQPLYSAKQVEEALVHAGCRPDARAQDLTVAQFAAVHNHLQGAGSAGAAEAPGEGEPQQQQQQQQQ